MGAEDQFSSNPDMPYDLRQTYAMGILTPILISIEMHRTKNEFSQWFDCLTMGLHTNINQKLDEDEKKEYTKIETKTIETLNKHPSVYQGKDKSALQVYEVKIALKQLEMWLKDKMQKRGLFGSGWSDDEDSL